MSVFKLWLCDIREGIFKNKRYTIVPFICIFECMYAHMSINSYQLYYDVHSRPTFLALWAEIFHGCDPITKNPDPNLKIELPYFWIAIFIFAIFIGFDYMHNDLTQFGIQVLSRTRKRSRWWISKCFWCLSSGIYFYIIFLLTAIVFSIINGYDLSLSGSTELLNIIADRSVIYTFTGISELNIFQELWMLFSPMLVICTFNMIQMILCLFIKPMYGYLLIVGILILGILTDIPLAFSRCGMITFSDYFFEDGYHISIGLAICLILIMASILIGTLYFKKYDILPDKE